MWNTINQMTSIPYGEVSTVAAFVKCQPDWLRISVKYRKRNGHNSVKTLVENILNALGITL